MSSGEFTDRPRHSEAANLLSLIGMPELLEVFSTTEIKEFFDDAGYQEVPPGTATVGWGRRVDQPDALTMCFVLTKDKKLLEIDLGGMGGYSWGIQVEDVLNPSESEIKKIKTIHSAGILKSIRQSSKCEQYVATLLSYQATDESRKKIHDLLEGEQK